MRFYGIWKIFKWFNATFIYFFTPTKISNLTPLKKAVHCSFSENSRASFMWLLGDQIHSKRHSAKYNEYFFDFLPSGTLTSHPLLRASEKVMALPEFPWFSLFLFCRRYGRTLRITSFFINFIKCSLFFIRANHGNSGRAKVISAQSLTRSRPHAPYQLKLNVYLKHTLINIPFIGIKAQTH